VSNYVLTYIETMSSAAKTTKTLTTNEVFSILEGTVSDCLGQIEDLFADNRIDRKTFSEVESFLTTDQA
jgi:hypothetical protein